MSAALALGCACDQVCKLARSKQITILQGMDDLPANLSVVVESRARSSMQVALLSCCP